MSDAALDVFRNGSVMSKGTTDTKGIVTNYFANIFGPPQYREMHEVLAKKYFDAMFEKEIFVGQLRTQLGIVGYGNGRPADISPRTAGDDQRKSARRLTLTI